eukprot:Mrub_01773.p1 GENE.Mrub_01773~~Mrub_01773.p1  ORF type:complete len:630 (-),score=134.44 Mrub_01773:94-1914(-)
MVKDLVAAVDSIYTNIGKHDKLLQEHQTTVDYTEEWKAKYGHIKFEEWEQKFYFIERRIDTIEEWMPTLEPRFAELHAKIDANYTELKEYTDNKIKVVYDEMIVQMEKLDKKIVSVDCDLKAYNEIQDKKIDNLGYKINECFSIQEATRTKLEKFTKRLIDLETQFNSLNFDTFLTKQDLENYKLIVNQQIEEIKIEANEKFLIKDIGYKMINQVDNQVQLVRGELLDYKDKTKYIPGELKMLNSLINETRKYKAEKLYVDELVQKVEIMKQETIKISGMQDELQKNSEIKDEIDIIKDKLHKTYKIVLDKMDKTEKETIMSLIKEKAQTARQNHNEFLNYKKSAQFELHKIDKLHDRIDGIGGKNASKEEFIKFKESFQEYTSQNEEEFNNLRQYFNSKLTLKGDKDWIKRVINKLKDAWKEFENKERDRNDAILTKKVINDANCASCDKHMKELNAENVKYRDWNKIEKQEAAKIGKNEVSRSISNFGKGYSRYIALDKKFGNYEVTSGNKLGSYSYNYDNSIEKVNNDIKNLVYNESNKSKYSIRNKIEIKRRKVATSCIIDSYNDQIENIRIPDDESRNSFKHYPSFTSNDYKAVNTPDIIN